VNRKDAVTPLTPRRLLALALAGATLVAAACGGDDDEADAPAAPAATGAGEATEATDAATPAGDTVTIVDAQDRTVEVPRDPETVVVMDWSVIRTLTDLGIEVDAVPQSNGTLPPDLAPVAEAATTVGTLFEPDYEAISALQPDLIIVGSRSGTPEVVAEMERITPTVIDMSVRYEDAGDQLPQFVQRVEQLASIFGVEEEAAARLERIQQSIDELAADAAASGRTALFVQVSGGTVAAYGPGSRFGIVYDDFGFTPTEAPVDDEGSHGQEISQEFFVQYDPGVIFVLDRSKAIGEEATPALEVLDNGLVDSTDAARDGKIVEVDGFAWYLATYAPSSVEQMIDDARAGL